MKMTKKWLAVLLCMMVLVAALTVTANAAGGATNVAFTVEKTEVNVGDTFTVTFSNKAMTVKGFSAGFFFDKALLECVSIVGVDPAYPNDYSLILKDGGRNPYVTPTAVSTVEKANENGTVGYAYIGVNDVAYIENTLLVVTFKAKAAGTANFTLYEETNGTDAFKSDSIETKTVTIKTTTPACTHETTKLVPNANGTHNVVCANTECNAVVTENVTCTGTDDGNCTTAVVCECGNVVTPASNGHAFNSKASNQQKAPADCENAATYYVQCDNCNAVSDSYFVAVGQANGHSHSGYNTDATTHQSICSCGKAIGEAEAHNFQNDAHKCVCGEVEYFTITLDANGGKFSNGAPVYPVKAQYGVVFNAVPDDPTCEGFTFTGWNTKADGTGESVNVAPGTLYFTENLTVYAQWKQNHVCAPAAYADNGDGTHTVTCSCQKVLATAEKHVYGEKHVCACGVVEPSGWIEIDGSWYYVYPTTYVKATGCVRLPYPTVAINDITYGPNADDKAYWEAHKDTSKYSDATSAVFVFDENGKFLQTTGIVNNNRYAVNGMIGWHVGLVEVEGEYYYFKGDVDGGGNILVTGNVYVTRNTTKLEVKLGGIYTFAADGKLCKYNGITKIGEVLYYYDNYRLATDAGLIKNGEGYSYVRSSNEKAGQLVVNRSYWVSKGNGLMAEGMYEFDANGLIVMENKQEGIVEVGGVYYYYKAGVKQIGAGVVKMTDDAGETFYIYVKSDGSLATGKYWPTNRNDLLERGEYDWGTDGKYYPGK